MSFWKNFGAVVGAAVVAGAMSTGAAHAGVQDGVDAGAAASVYKLTVVPGSMTDPQWPLDWSKAESATLTCDPAGGSHPQAEKACELIAESGSIARIAQGAYCPRIYSPVTAFSVGSEKYRETYSNRWCLNSDKGAVFQF
ncbi:hypothetical protein HNR23_003015 [Nocardiopsis mwathae]|uniref:Subtilisin inhibitor domain-containing protein n=1 Tax=Nocardiopsis mwathae TaxID=1472723 RepID=A0A7X0D672_9ACTN|nr:SSI family serine proteinase inhibitor [Nocardiopsis mwathae]MBB6172955.1 hypothetical protein [Nocardiopsis mwathae]